MLTPHFWHQFTWLGDTSLLLPLALLVALRLAMFEDTRPLAWCWVGLFGLGGAMITGSKLAFMGWGLGSEHLDFTGFSGHTAMAASVWPVLLWLLVARRGVALQALLVLLGWLLAAAIGWSRLEVHAHSVSEVVSGLLLGLAVSSAFLGLAWQRPSPVHRARWLPLAMLLPLLWLEPGRPAPTQHLLERIAVKLAGREEPHRRKAPPQRPPWTLGADNIRPAPGGHRIEHPGLPGR